MAITTTMPVSSKLAFLRGEHLAADSYKMALIKAAHAGTYGNNTTAYGTNTGAPTNSNLGTDEVVGAGYTAGGFTMAGYTTSISGTEALLDWTTDPNWTTATISADGAMLYNDTDAGKPVVAVYAFVGAPISSTAGTFTATLPAATAGNAVVRIA
jgi:hypothetical protein